MPDATTSARGDALRPPFGRGRTAAKVLARVIDGAAAVGCRLPASLAHQLAVIGGHIEWAVRPGKRQVLATNLAHAIGESADSPAVRRLVRYEIVNEARRSADLLWAIGRPGELIERVEIVGIEHAVVAAQRGRGVILAGVHLGGWEVVAAIPAAVLPVPTTVIVADNWLAWAMDHVRTSGGLRVVYRSASALTAARVLQRGEALLVFGDDAAGTEPRRHLVRFCDASARLPAGAAALARLCGAAIVPFSVVPVARRRWRATMEPMITSPERGATDGDEAALLQDLADAWTAQIRAHPDQWAASFPIAWDS